MFTNSMIRPLMKSIKFLYPKLRERIFWLGSAHGWLIMVGEDGHFHLLNPLNGNQISLPPKSSFESVRQYPEEFTSQEDRDLLAVRATLSSDPASGDFVFLVIYLAFNATCLSCYRSVDKQWSRFKPWTSGIFYANGQFYSIPNHGQILSCEVNPKSIV